MILIGPRDRGARALRAYETQRDQRSFSMPYDKLSGDAQEVCRRAFDRLSAAMAVEGLTVVVSDEE